MTDGFWSNKFHRRAAAAGFIAASEDRIGEADGIGGMPLS